jgi:hypothetical protein
MTLLKGIDKSGSAETLDESRLQELNVERMLVGFLRSLLEEQRGELLAETESTIHPEFSGGGHS